MPVTEISKKNNFILDRVLYIYYLVYFKKNEIRSLINSDSEVNAITPAYASQRGLKIQKINIGVWKIDCFTLLKFEIVLASF